MSTLVQHAMGANRATPPPTEFEAFVADERHKMISAATEATADDDHLSAGEYLGHSHHLRAAGVLFTKARVNLMSGLGAMGGDQGALIAKARHDMAHARSEVERICSLFNTSLPTDLPLPADIPAIADVVHNVAVAVLPVVLTQPVRDVMNLVESSSDDEERKSDSGYITAGRLTNRMVTLLSSCEGSSSDMCVI